MTRPRVLVTGLGAVTPFGLGVDPLWRGLLAGRSAIRPIAGFDAAGLDVRIAGEVPDFRPADHMDAKAARRMDRFAQFAIAAAGEAIADAALAIDDGNREQIGVVIHTGGGGLVSFEHTTRSLVLKGPKFVPLLAIPTYIPNMASSQVSITYGIHGPALTGVGACAAGVMAIAEAVHLIEAGIVDVALAGAAEACLTPTIVAGFDRAGALSHRNDDPAGACRPFALDRDGTVLSEGACVLVLESEAHAVRRGARAICRAHGGATTSDAHHVTAPDPSGVQAARAMSLALARAGLRPADIDLVAAHATASTLGDVAETVAIRLAFGDEADRLAVTATKSMAGHLIGAAGALSSLVCALAIRDRVAPPTINLETPDPDCALDHVPGAARPMPVRAAIANGFAFGGQNAAAVFSALA